MRKGLIWIGTVVVVAVVAVAAVHFRGNLFRGAPRGAQQSSWLPVPHPPGDRPKPELAMIKEFGAWHLSCVRQGQQAPKVGYIQNLGITPDQTGKPKPCHVFIMMRDPTAPGQTMRVSFRYRTGFDEPELVILYTTLGKPHVIYDRQGNMQDLSQHKGTLRGGFYLDPSKAPPGNKQHLEPQDKPDIGIQLGGTRFTMFAQACVRAHCFAHLPVRAAAIGSVSKIVVRLPGPPHGQPRVVDVPADGLEPALAELERLQTS